MARRTDLPRDTNPRGPELFRSREEKAQLEARNGLLQFNEVVRLINQSIGSGDFALTPEILKHLHRVAIDGIYRCAGNYRNHPISIHNTDHQPPPADQVPALTLEMCDYANRAEPLHASAFVMWRLNWIHPFAGGNGRCSRAASYLVLCAKIRQRLPGTLTIPEQIVACRQPYYAALDAADAAWQRGYVDVSAMEQLLSGMAYRQILDAVMNPRRP